MIRKVYNLNTLPLGLLSGDAWVPMGERDLLIRQVNDLRFIGAGALADTESRWLINREGPPCSDHGIEVVMDVSRPYTDTGNIGVVVCWQTSPLESDGTYQRSNPNDVVRAFAGAGAEDFNLGLDNCVTVFWSNGNTISVTELLDGVPQNLGSCTVQNTLVRRLALRVVHVDGEVLVWANFDGELEFFDLPVLRVATLVRGSMRPGIFCFSGIGRFLHVAAESQVETITESPHLDEIVSPGLNLTPVRVRLVPDRSRPPMLVDASIAHWTPTKLPERQQRMSRVFLQDARFSARPGHRYVATVASKNVDGDWSISRSPVFTVAGTGEDARPRDRFGFLILAPDDEVPEGEQRSMVQMLRWPSSIEPAELSAETRPTGANTSQYMDGRFRGTQTGGLAPRVFELKFVALTVEQLRTLSAFIRDALQEPFLWTHPLSGEEVIVKFTQPAIDMVGEDNRYTLNLSLIEDFVPESPGAQGIGPPTCVIVAGEEASKQLCAVQATLRIYDYWWIEGPDIYIRGKVTGEHRYVLRTTSRETLSYAVFEHERGPYAPIDEVPRFIRFDADAQFVSGDWQPGGFYENNPSTGYGVGNWDISDRVIEGSVIEPLPPGGQDEETGVQENSLAGFTWNIRSLEGASQPWVTVAEFLVSTVSDYETVVDYSSTCAPGTTTPDTSSTPPSSTVPPTTPPPTTAPPTTAPPTTGPPTTPPPTTAPPTTPPPTTPAPTTPAPTTQPPTSICCLGGSEGCIVMSPSSNTCMAGCAPVNGDGDPLIGCCLCVFDPGGGLPIGPEIPVADGDYGYILCCYIPGTGP